MVIYSDKLLVKFKKEAKMKTTLITTVLLAFFILGISSVSIAEEMTITTYYPAPYGSYKQLKTDNFAVGTSVNPGYLVRVIGSAGVNPLDYPLIYVEENDSSNQNSFQGVIYVHHLGGAGMSNRAIALVGASDGSAATGGTNIGGLFTANNNTNNYGVQIMGPTAGASNYALYSSSQAQSFFNGAVGIGTQAPTAGFLLDVNGTARCQSLTQYSSKTHKKDIQPLVSADYRDILSKLQQTNVFHFRYKEASNDSKLKVGLIAEESPKEIVSSDGKGIDLGETISFALAAIKAQQEQIEDLKGQINQLKSRVSR